MLDYNQIVLTAWHPSNNKWYILKGYIYTHRGNSLSVKVKDLKDGSNVEVSVTCDYCMEKYNSRYSDYIKVSLESIIKKDSCPKCYKIRVIECNMFLYGVENAMQRKEVKEKTKATNLEKYGFENVMHYDAIKGKVAQTNMKKYGFKSPSENKDIKNKIIETNNERYGGNSPSNNVDIRQKQIDTTFERYGVSYSMLNEEVRAKGIQSLYNNQTAPTSRQQYYIHNLVGGELNLPVTNLFLDISFPEEKIYLEIDLGGHDLQVKLGKVSSDEFLKSEKRRWYTLFRRGWREIRIISSDDKIPNDEKLIEIMKLSRDYLNTGRHTIKFNLDKQTIKTTQSEDDFDFGELRYVYKKDIDKIKENKIS